MQLPLNSIKIKKRVRKDLGEIIPLMNSLKKYGLFSPILIDSDYELIAGHRRLEAARRLGWNSIEARILEKNSRIEKLEIELEENIQRRNLSADEISDGINALDKLLHPNFFRRIINFFLNLFKKIFYRKRIAGK